MKCDSYWKPKDYLVGEHGMEAVYTQLSLKERRKIKNWWHAKMPIRDGACSQTPQIGDLPRD